MCLCVCVWLALLYWMVVEVEVVRWSGLVISRSKQVFKKEEK